MIKTTDMDTESISCPVDKYKSNVTLFHHLARKCDWVFLGDSITNAGRWSELFPNLEVSNQGIDGDTTKGLLARLKLVTELKPKVVFIMGGINDIIQERSEKVIMENFQKIIDTLLAEGCKVVIQSTLLTGTQEWNIGVCRLNSELKALANQHNIEFIDLNSVFSFEGEIPEYATYDGVHLQAEMYIPWSKAILELEI